MTTDQDAYSGLLVSADSHLMEDPELWATRLPSGLRAEAPRFTKAAVFQGQPGGSDPHKRVAEMEVDGVSAEVIYPTLALGLYVTVRDEAIQEACFRVYNDFVAEYCSVAPDRLIGIATISTYNIDTAVQELERARRLGLRGAMIWQTPPDHIPLYSDHYDRLWDAAQDLAMPMSLHILTGFDWSRRVAEEAMTGRAPSQEEREKAGHFGFRDTVNLKLLGAMNGLHDILFSGVFQRFPRLKVVLVENEIGWIPFALDQYDQRWERGRGSGRSPLPLDVAPSEYFRRHCYATFFNDNVGGRMLDWWGGENCMWSNDYPHHNSTWPHSRQAVQRILGHLNEETSANVTWRNVTNLYDMKSQESGTGSG